MIWDDWNSSSLGCIPVSPMIYIPEQLHGTWKYPRQEKEKRLPSTNQFVVFKIVSWHWGRIQKLKFDLVIIIYHAPLIWSVSIPSKVAGTFSLHLEKMVAKGWEMEGNGNFGGLRKLPISLIFLHTLYIYTHYTITHCLGDSFWCPCQHFRLIILKSIKERVHFCCCWRVRFLHPIQETSANPKKIRWFLGWEWVITLPWNEHGT